MNKKSQIFEFMTTYGWAILVVIVVLGVLLYFGVIGTPNWRLQHFCEYEPDKCVLTPIKFSITKHIGKSIPNSMTEEQCNSPDTPQKYKNGYCKFRKKTPTELLNCERNPREDNDCKCEQFEDSERLAWLFNRVRLKEKNISIEDFKYVTYTYSNDTRIECRNPPIQDCFIYEITTRNAFCNKARPK